MAENNRETNLELQLLAAVLPWVLFSKEQAPAGQGQVQGILFREGATGGFPAGLNVQFRVDYNLLLQRGASREGEDKKEGQQLLSDRKTPFQGYTARVEITENRERQCREIFLREIKKF